MRFIIAAVAATVSLVPASAIAQPADTLVVHGVRALADNQRSVDFGDLQLASLSGQRELRARIDRAITILCDSSHFSVSDPQGSLKCASQAWRDVSPDLARLTPRLASR